MAEKKTLLSMGFSHSLVEMAWKKHGNFDSALNDLISYSDSIPVNSQSSTTASPEIESIVCDDSQYSFGGGSSSCTPISVFFASQFVTKEGNASDSYFKSMMTSALMDGISCQNELGLSSGHLAVDEFFAQAPAAVTASLTKVADPIQILLTEPNAFESLFDRVTEALQPRSQHGTNSPQLQSRHAAVILTKPPETIALFLPTRAINSVATASSQLNEAAMDQAFYLFDSHGRPQLGLCGAYLIKSASCQGIIAHLNKLYHPFTSDGDGGDDNYLMWMYNTLEGQIFIATEREQIQEQTSSQAPEQAVKPDPILTVAQAVREDDQSATSTENPVSVSEDPAISLTLQEDYVLVNVEK